MNRLHREETMSIDQENAPTMPTASEAVVRKRSSKTRMD
jgi:hypothetical protein